MWKYFLLFCLLTATSLVNLAIFSVGLLHGIGAYLLFSFENIEKSIYDTFHDSNKYTRKDAPHFSSLFQRPFISFASISASSSRFCWRKSIERRASLPWLFLCWYQGFMDRFDHDSRAKIRGITDRGAAISGPWIPCWSGSLWNNWWKPSASSIVNIIILFL